MTRFADDCICVRMAVHAMSEIFWKMRRYYRETQKIRDFLLKDNNYSLCTKQAFE